MNQKLAAVPGALALATLALCAPAQAQSADAELAEQVRQLRAELQQVRQELDAMKKQAAPVASTPAAPSWSGSPAPAVVPAPAAAPVAAVAPQANAGLSLFGYGELSYSRPTHDTANSVANVGRAVLGWGYRFNERTRMAAELEIENAIASSSDSGEAAIEQMYVEHDLNSNLTAKAGLFLMPAGILNESHEPTRYFGVFRNQVETAIIPTTWRELGVGLQGTTDQGLRWNTGIVTGFDLTKWDPTSSDGRDSPLGSIHQEGQLAKARTLATYLALNYSGIPGFNIGGSVYYGGAGQKQTGFAAPDATVTLAEAHARWQPGRWDLSALAARGRFSGVDALNATFAGQPTPVPDRFGGWYAQAAYKVWSAGEQALWPFARYERLNTAEGYSGLPQGLAPTAQPDTRTVTIGANYYLHPQVVLKADYMRFFDDSSRDRFNLGVGFEF
ncbi:hypothetical protein HHL11_23430 [Ramlibacter sp. G-1-2-2]|uniref:Porin n=1 Tax=Ramlibacter agri TaxID=2728837 RepID=A0A848H7E8_9BURK|nr:hypothetical protein [Ramlibacter agri]NML46715.1 hypothetical protein [Ramlibacter agri]